MKKILALLFAILSINIAAAQTTPTIVVIKFETDYPAIVPVWTFEECYYRVEYLDKKNDTWRSILYDNAGYVIRRDWKMSNNYPIRIDDYYTAVYPNEKFEVWSSVSDRGCQNYYVIRNSGKIWFDGNGKPKNCTL